MKLQINLTRTKKDGVPFWLAEVPGASFEGNDRGQVVDEIKRIVYRQFAMWMKPPSYVQFEVIE